MSNQRKTPADVLEAVESFKRLVAPQYRDHFSVTPPYRIVGPPGQICDWPKSYDLVWKKNPAIGVYLIFDQDDRLIYVGKAVSIGYRLGAYFRYARETADDQSLAGTPKRQRPCEVKDAALRDAGCAIVRAVVLDEGRDGKSEVGFLTPALEWFLISRLDPVVNIQGRPRETWEEAGSPV